ncbi:MULTISPECIES: ribbon-helix-helix protein, CopG family [Moorena]|uniref:Ribbon-helix-helix protein, CopG family n=1 Tax=Moorena producens (strain JHB) TaxID=1454205 RepID=A0A1D9G5G3_MOOP1|nr:MULTISPECIES: ribbon-helix-helix protein, CopG family [Moorena]AOY82879.1 ribbon-helix-helix protein, CopG family [Moorena producens JHB]NEQ06029.1 ribbon-helix-helix protein, CopG family [Moorena sp. SIO4E2]NER89962.1 ribbon-helix-helix protein, CopG family [Moorena sp. SIO3A2]NES42676.1 ribbon-helix-helix protein, CopG family [Moorena sp. SIO2C4]
MSRKLVSFRLSEDLAQALKDRAEEKGISVTELINRLLRQGLETDDSVEERLTVVESSVENLRKQTNVTDLALAIQGVAQSLGGSTVPKTDSHVERRLDELQELFLEMNENLNQVLDQEPSSRKPRSSLSKGSKSARLRNLVKGKQSSVNPEIPQDSQFRDY